MWRMQGDSVRIVMYISLFYFYFLRLPCKEFCLKIYILIFKYFPSEILAYAQNCDRVCVKLCVVECLFNVPIRFQVYFMSRYRGMCVGTLVSRAVVLTACVCVTHPGADVRDTRPINVVTGTMYRHPRRGIRVQVTKILIPKCK